MFWARNKTTDCNIDVQLQTYQEPVQILVNYSWISNFIDKL